MSASLEALRALFNKGYYVEIVERWGRDRSLLDTLTSKQRILVAQAAFQVGQISSALYITGRESATTLPSELRSRCEALFGLIDRRHGHWNSAQKHFHLSLQLAKDAHHATQIGWSYLWLFRTLAELGPAARVAAMVSEVRASITRAGDSQLCAYMHDSIALMEASAGRTQEARRHLQISSGLLERHPNAWLQQRLFLSKSFLDYLECRYEDTLQNLRSARELTPIAGAGLSPIIECNEAHALVVTGRFTAAEKYLRRVAASDSPQYALGALEGLARLYLATDRLPECRDALAACEPLKVDPAVESAFAGRWSSITRLKLLLRQEAFRDALSESNKYLAQVDVLDDKMLRSALLLLKSEAQSGIGASIEALEILFQFGATESICASRQQAAYYRAIAVALAHSGSELCHAQFERCLAICRAQDNFCGDLELRQLDPLREAVRQRGRRNQTDMVVRVADALAASFNVSHDPALLARELLCAIEALGCSKDAQLTEASVTQTSDLADHRYAMSLGDINGRHLSLRCRIPENPALAVALAGVFRIGSAAISLQRLREDERNRAALWPETPAEKHSGALFISEEMQTLLSTARRVAATSIPVLITGETGTGKEVLARAIQGYSNRSTAAFLPFNCTSTPKDMLDSQLFGHRRGSFTGATDNFQGVIRAAAGGTLFLDEIGDMGLDVQPKLLRFLESNEVHPVGETQPVRVDVRVIAATNANLDALVSEGRFREDLFYRLNIVRLHLPPLRERRMEIPALAQHYLQKYAQEYTKGDLRLAEETMEYLVLYRWPGNIRQLANEMRRMAALCESGAVLMPEYLSPEIAASRRTIPASERILDSTEVVVRLDQPLAAATEHLERAAVQYALKQCGGRMEETAAMLGLSRKGLYLKRLRFGIETPESSAVVV